MIKKSFLKDALGWGLVLWLIGYVLGIIFIFMLPLSLVGWVIMPIGIVITWWVSSKKVLGDTLGYYAAVASTWTVMAIVFDYAFIVKAFNPPDGYYKPDVYLYYTFTFIIPLVAGLKKKNVSGGKNA